MWADVLGFDCLVTVAAASGVDAGATASDGGGRKFGFRGRDAEVAWARKSGEPGQVSGAEDAGRVVFSPFGEGVLDAIHGHFVAARGPEAEHWSPPPHALPGGGSTALKVALLPRGDK